MDPRLLVVGMADWIAYLTDEERLLLDRLQRRVDAVNVIVVEAHTEIATLRERAQKRRTRAKQKEA